MGLLGLSLGGLLQPPAVTEVVTVVSVVARDNLAAWTFSHVIAGYSADTPLRLEAAAGDQWSPAGGNDGVVGGVTVYVEYSSDSLTQWRILQAPSITFAGGIQMKVPQSGIIASGD